MSVTFEISWGGDMEGAEQFVVKGTLPESIAAEVFKDLFKPPVSTIKENPMKPPNVWHTGGTKHVDINSMRQNLPDTAVVEYLLDLLNEGNDFYWHRTNSDMKDNVLYTAG